MRQKKAKLLRAMVEANMGIGVYDERYTRYVAVQHLEGKGQFLMHHPESPRGFYNKIKREYKERKRQ